ncbi:hypothetical protein LEP1GSC127_4211 [Leptospira kirschneri str. 200801925]|nr:hypothetical protein LEP1GSC198_0064 [Leptospira kirschneri str. JB]EMK08294.1 hypothetical protein LEP1GSC166_2959 [Leptospira kirschneri]EMO74310.1 hypothetical protein LEP1GSC127_4211 [Leptospira kirschneri str. 200801925]EMO80236.1 hypothetical protein LEP1GSC126_3310 [Leptospira kirschneri str. 200801774]
MDRERQRKLKITFIKFKKEDHLIEFITKSLFDDRHKIKNSVYKDFLKIKQI